jgi:hypothetical protein
MTCVIDCAHCQLAANRSPASPRQDRGIEFHVALSATRSASARTDTGEASGTRREAYVEQASSIAVELPAAVPQIAHEILERDILPADGQVDALHIAAASFHEVEYLLTWNCKHIANAQVIRKIRGLLLELGYPVPVICTPDEMVGEDEYEQ